MQADANEFLVLAKRWATECASVWNESARRFVICHDHDDTLVL
ncbi:hypothetical protein [Xanthomonas theicola]